MISRHLTPYLTPERPQGRYITNLTPLTYLRARDAKKNAARIKVSHVTRDPVIGVRLVRLRGLSYSGVRYGVRWREINHAEERAAS